MKTEKITKEDLKSIGMNPTLDPVIKYEKIIGEGEDGKLAIVLTSERNVLELALSMPDGSMLYLRPQTIDHLQIFESCIESWSPVY